MIWIAIVLLAAGPADLDGIRAMTDAPKRAVKAIDYASQTFTQARDLISAGDFDAAKTALATTAEAAELARDSTQVKRNVGAMKKVEQRSRDLLRRLETLILDLPVDDREAVEPIRQRIRKVQEDVLASIMGRRK